MKLQKHQNDGNRETDKPDKMHTYPNGGGVLFIVMDTFELLQYLVIMV